ncbi:MAG TPA: YceH family protein [Bryobacteraceae bacterium]|nr:YceH family protein [Bryobacteraceae bacterium]
MNIVLKHPEVRVLASLIEKENTTPEYYPLTLNALVAACNQKSNRFPATDFDDSTVLDALAGLRGHGFAAEIISGGRVPKYAQRFTEKLNLGRRETAILCVLMLRGPQTLGEIKGRTERLYAFADLDEVETVVRKLINRPEGALVQEFAPAPGMKEPRFGQTLGGISDQPLMVTPVSVVSSANDRLSALETEVSKLREEVNELRRRLEEVL